MQKHIESFPVSESHYLGNPVYYLKPELNTKLIYELFKQKYKNTKVSYSFYLNFFKENFNLRFGQPQVDSCSKCEKLKVKIKSPHLNETAKWSAVAELIIHKRRTNKFYSAIQNEVTDSKKKVNKNTLAITFDYCSNVSLPKLPVQELYYMRQLTVNIFSIHDVKQNKASCYMYHEGQAKKGPDEVCSFLWDYLQNIPDNITEVHLYSDNCPGQHKNHSLARFLLALTDTKRFEKIINFF